MHVTGSKHAGWISILCTESWFVFLTRFSSVGSITNGKRKGIHPLWWTVTAVLSVTRDERDFGLNECFSVWIQTVWELRHYVVQLSGFHTVSCGIHVLGLCHEETRKAKEEKKVIVIQSNCFHSHLQSTGHSGKITRFWIEQPLAKEQVWGGWLCVGEPEVPPISREDTHGELGHKVWILFGGKIDFFVQALEMGEMPKMKGRKRETDRRALQDQDAVEMGDSEVWKGSVWHSHGKEPESGV